MKCSSEKWYLAYRYFKRLEKFTGALGLLLQAEGLSLRHMLPTDPSEADLFPSPLFSLRQHMSGDVDESMFVPLVTAHMSGKASPIGVTVHPQLYTNLGIDGIGSLAIASSLADRNGSIASLRLYEILVRSPLSLTEPTSACLTPVAVVFVLSQAHVYISNAHSCSRLCCLYRPYAGECKISVPHNRIRFFASL